MSSEDQSDLMKQAHARVKQASPEEHVQWEAEGVAGTAAHAAGGRAFGPRTKAPPRKRRRANELGDYLRAIESDATPELLVRGLFVRFQRRLLRNRMMN